MRIIIILPIVAIFNTVAYGQSPNPMKSKKASIFNSKRFTSSNLFYTYTNEGGSVNASMLKVVKPSRPFWGTIKDDGTTIFVKKDFRDNAAFKWMDADSIQIPHPTLGQVYLANQTYFPESFFTKSNIDSVVFLRSRQDFRRLSSVKYMDAKFVLQAISIPLKFRKGIDTIPYQTETGVNLGFGIGVKWAYNWYNSKKSFLGQKTNQLSFTPGLLIGLGGVDVKAKVNAPATFKDRKEPVISYGFLLLAGFNSINLGVAIGEDRALKDAGKAGGWIYHGKRWTGIIFALDLLK